LNPGLSDEVKRATVKALKQAAGNRTHAAAILGVSPSTMSSRVRALLADREWHLKVPEAPGGVMGDGPMPYMERTRTAVAKKEHEALEKRLAEAEERLRVIGSAREHLDTIRIAPPSKGKLRPAVAVSPSSDWHVEEPVEPEKVFGKNAYNLQIAEARAAAYFQGLLWKIRHHQHSYEIRRLLMLGIGDFISGYIHPELIETAQLSPTLAIAFWVERYAAGVRMLLDSSDLEIDLVLKPGNHGRTGEKITVATRAENSFEYLGFLLLMERFKGEKRIHFELSKGVHTYVEVYDWVIRATHGDDIRYQGGVGGLAIPLRKAVDSWNDARHSDYTVFGHWHQHGDYGFAVGNGSLIGYSPYSIWIKARYEAPSQSMFLIDRERGKDMVSPIWVDPQGRRGVT
jgi:hypothetical protein